MVWVQQLGMVITTTWDGDGYGISVIDRAWEDDDSISLCHIL